MAKTWQSRAVTWQRHGKNMTKTLQKHGKSLAATWQKHGKNMGSPALETCNVPPPPSEPPIVGPNDASPSAAREALHSESPSWPQSSVSAPSWPQASGSGRPQLQLQAPKPVVATCSWRLSQTLHTSILLTEFPSTTHTGPPNPATFINLPPLLHTRTSPRMVKNTENLKLAQMSAQSLWRPTAVSAQAREGAPQAR